MIKNLLVTTALVGVLTSVLTSPAYSASIAGRNIPSPITGLTFDDDLSNKSQELTTVKSVARFPTVRVVIDPGVSAASYKSAMTTLYPSTFFLIELVDSSYMAGFSLSHIQTLTANMTAGIGSTADIWEIGNEINGNWLSNLSNGSDVMPKTEAMYDSVSNQGGKTFLTFFYEGEPNESHNCIATDHGGNDMFTWIATNFTSHPTAETEKIRLGLNYVGISWYPDQCPGESPNWGNVYTKLAQIFPNAQVGFSELGTANPQGGSAYEKNEISSIYPMTAGVGGLPSNYFSGVFWWYAAEEMVPWPGSLGNTLNAALGGATPMPPSATLSASPASITSGQFSTLTYASVNTLSCTGINFTPTGTQGMVQVSPTTTTTYSLTCTGVQGGTAAAQATITVTACP